MEQTAFEHLKEPSHKKKREIQTIEQNPHKIYSMKLFELFSKFLSYTVCVSTQGQEKEGSTYQGFRIEKHICNV